MGGGVRVGFAVRCQARWLALLLASPLGVLGCGDSGRPGTVPMGSQDASTEAGLADAGDAGGGGGGKRDDGGGGGAGGKDASLDAGVDAGALVDAGPGTDAGPQRLVSQVVDSSGGLVVGPGITLSFPPDALATATEITIDEGTLDFPAGLTAVTPMFALGPDAITFARPVTLCLTPDRTPGSKQQAIVLHTALGKTAFEVATGCGLEPGSGVTRCCGILHFSSTGMVNGPKCGAGKDLCNDGICRSSCGTRCKAGTSRCGGTCAPTDGDANCGYCGNACTGGHACDATDRTCVCPVGAAFECQGTCVADRDACLLGNPCTVAEPFRCPDTSCAASYAVCDGTCPSATPYECDSGYCVASSNECDYHACPEGQPFLCYDGVSCSENTGAQCPAPVTCPETAPVRCTPGGTCAESLALCPAGAVCPEMAPIHCDTGPCVADVSECAAYPCPEGKPYLCADNVTCAVSDTFCP